jgi:hypothetical protein
MTTLSVLPTGLVGSFWADSSRHASLFLHVIFGCVATSALLAAGVDPVLASSGATVFYLIIAFVLCFKRQQPAAVFCGTFAGMTSFFVFFNKAPFSLGFSILVYLGIAIVTGSLYVLIMHFEHKLPKQSFNGYGGRLGAIAFIPSAVCLITTGLLIRLFSARGWKSIGESYCGSLLSNGTHRHGCLARADSTKAGA